MELELTSEQELFAETTRRFLEAEVPISRVRELHDHGAGLDFAYWRKGAELGWTAMLVPATSGGGDISGNGLLDLALVAEEMGRLVSPGPLLTVNVVLDTLSRSGSAEQRSSVVPKLLSGRNIATWAYAEGATTWSTSSMALRAEREGDRWVLTGVKTFVPDAPDAEWFLVTACTQAGLAQFLVPADSEGVTITKRVSLDLVRAFADVSFDRARLPSSCIVGTAGGAVDDVERQLQVALVLQNAETVGALDRVLSLTLEYATQRVAFGRTVASYQAIKHRLADMKTWVEACHAAASVSARAVTTGANDRAELISVAKSYIADQAPRIVQDCIQIHGGIGVTWDHDLHLYLRRITQNASLFGTVRDHREQLAAALLEDLRARQSDPAPLSTLAAKQPFGSGNA